MYRRCLEPTRRLCSCSASSCSSPVLDSCLPISLTLGRSEGRFGMRTIQVSIDVFHAIWKSRKAAEQSEDSILRRLLNVRTEPAKSGAGRDITTSVGYHDPRFGVELPVGFEIHRNYKGTVHTAQAIQGFWHYKGTGYPSL